MGILALKVKQLKSIGSTYDPYYPACVGRYADRNAYHQ